MCLHTVLQNKLNSKQPYTVSWNVGRLKINILLSYTALLRETIIELQFTSGESSMHMVAT